MKIQQVEAPQKSEALIDVERLWTVKDVASFLSLSEKLIYVLVARGELPHMRISKRAIRFKRDEILNWVNTQ